MKLCSVFTVGSVLVKLTEHSVFADGPCARDSMSLLLLLFFFTFLFFNLTCWYFEDASFTVHAKSAKDGLVPYQLSVFRRALDCISF